MQQAARTPVDLPVSVRSEQGQIILQLRDLQCPLSPQAARHLASELTQCAVEAQAEDDRVLGVAPDGSWSNPEGQGP